MASEDPRWLNPPEPGAVDINISVDQDAQLTPEVRRALDDLVKALEAEEVLGYTRRPPNPPPPNCPTRVNCAPDGRCAPRVRYPGCATTYSSCRVTSPE